MPRKSVEINPVLAERIRERRKGRGLTQKRLAELVGANEQTIRAYERGRTGASHTMVMAIASVLECPVSYLYGESDDLNTPHEDFSMEIPARDDVTITLQREDAENLLRLLGKLNFYRIGAALSDNPALQECDVTQTTKSVARAYKAFDDVVGLKWQAVKDEKEEETK